MINTLDLDNITKEQFFYISLKIIKKDCCKDFKWKYSSSKGFHVIFNCIKKCDICRFVFDDMKRYEIDFNRDLKFQNTLFTEKEYFRGSMGNLEKNKQKKISITKTLIKIIAKVMCYLSWHSTRFWCYIYGKCTE